MKKTNQKKFIIASGLLALFMLWTAALLFVDVKAIGPRESEVGFATVNGFFHRLTGVNFTLYIMTDWLGLVPVGVVLGFGSFGLIQLIKRKSLLKVDFSILALGGYYIIVMTVYILFEFVVINQRPVLIEGVLETSYPSSTTMLVMTVMPTALMQFNSRIKNRKLKTFMLVVIVLFTSFMVVGRLVSGVHWLSDIIGGALFSAGLVMMYSAVCDAEIKAERNV